MARNKKSFGNETIYYNNQTIVFAIIHRKQLMKLRRLRGINKIKNLK